MQYCCGIIDIDCTTVIDAGYCLELTRLFANSVYTLFACSFLLGTVSQQNIYKVPFVSRII